MYENLKKMSIKAKEMLKNANSFLEVCLMELDQSKIINCVPDRILHNCPKPFSQRYCVAINCARRFKARVIRAIFFSQATQRFKFHRIAGASEVVTRVMEFVVRQY